jgi:hypothetical protein
VEREEGSAKVGKRKELSMYGRGDGELSTDGGGDGDSMFLPVTKDPLKLQPNALSAPFIDVERRDLVSFSNGGAMLQWFSCGGGVGAGCRLGQVKWMCGGAS